MGVNPPLALGETISARQELLGACKLKSADADPVVVAGQHAGAGGACEAAALRG